MYNELTVMVKETGKAPAVRTVPHTLEAFQELVGGYLDVVRLPKNIDMWVNDDGLIIGLPTNFELFKVIRGGTVWTPTHVQTIAGNVFFASHDDAGESTSLTIEQLAYVKQMFQYAGNYACVVK